MCVGVCDIKSEHRQKNIMFQTSVSLMPCCIKPGFPISIFLVGGALLSPLGGAPGVIGGGEQSTSACVNIAESTIALHTVVPLPITFPEEKRKNPS